MERGNTIREQLAEQQLGETLAIRRDIELTTDKNIVQAVDTIY